MTNRMNRFSVAGLLALLSALAGCSGNSSTPSVDAAGPGPESSASGGAGASPADTMATGGAGGRTDPVADGGDSGGRAEDAMIVRMDSAARDTPSSSDRNQDGAAMLAPVIVAFSATPPNLPQGGGATTLAWTVQNASELSIDKGVGSVSGSSVSVTATATTFYTLTASNAFGKASATTAVVVGQNKATGSSGRFVQMISPAPSESLLAPATLRLVAAGRDPNVYTNSPGPGLGGNAAQVQFFVDDTPVLAVDGAHAEYWVFKGFTQGVAAGNHRVWARATYTSPDEVLDSVPMAITVTAPPSYGSTVELTDDVQVGSAGYSLVGTAQSRVRLNGHGHSIKASATSGALTLRFVDVYDLGSNSDTSSPGIDVTTTGALVIEDSSFESCNPVKISLGGAATASVRRNTFHSNMRQPLGQSPDSYQSDGASYAAVHLEGTSTGQKVFAGNNIGAGWVEIVRAKQWTVGGDVDADSNVLIGPRVGLYASESSDVVFRRNYSHHVYLGGWSQGANFELFGTTGSVFEHNVVNDSSWPVRGGGTGSEFRYNLVLMAGHEWMQPAAGFKIHHNLFVGGDEDQGGIYVYNSQASPSAPAIGFYNNTLDGLAKDGIMAALRTGSTAGPVQLSSNAFLNYPKGQVILIEGGTVTADYNGFFACQATSYSDGRAGAHDVALAKAALRSPPSVAFSMDEGAIWTRATTVAKVLQAYRSNYEPTAASPLLGAGDPQIAAANWIGAIGDGTGELDNFGRP